MHRYLYLKARKRYIDDFLSRNFIMKIFFFLEMPIYFIIDFTLPPVEKPLLFKGQIAIYPFTTVWFLIFVTGNLHKTFPFMGHDVSLVIFLVPFQFLAAVLLCIT